MNLDFVKASSHKVALASKAPANTAPVIESDTTISAPEMAVTAPVAAVTFPYQMTLNQC